MPKCDEICNECGSAEGVCLVMKVCDKCARPSMTHHNGLDEIERALQHFIDAYGAPIEFDFHQMYAEHMQALTIIKELREAVPNDLTMHVKLMAIGDAHSASVVLKTCQTLSEFIGVGEG